MTMIKKVGVYYNSDAIGLETLTIVAHQVSFKPDTEIQTF
jgi:hypothetical protein